MTQTPDTRQSIGACTEQLSLFPSPEFSPIWPAATTIAGRVLAELLRGNALDHEDLIVGCRSWRLAAYVHDLKQKGWPIEAHEKPAPLPHFAGRFIASYALPRAIVSKVQEMRGRP